MKLFSTKKDFMISEQGISQIEKVMIGGIQQYLLIQSENVSNPVLLILHGGPGLPIPGVSSRSSDFVLATTTKELVKHYTLIFWDQRGSGKTFDKQISMESLNIDQFISDTHEVVQFLKNKFNEQKIYLAGYSWGTILGLRLVHENPSDFHAYIGISQIVNWTQNDVLCLEWTLNKARSNKNDKAIRELEQCGHPPYTESPDQWVTLRKWMAKYKTMIYTDGHVKHPGMKLAISLLLRSPDYSIQDTINTMAGFQKIYTQRMIEDFAEINFNETIKKVEVPVYFLHGRKDVHVYGELVDEFYEALEAPAGKHFFWLEKSSHIYHPDDAREIESILIDIKELLDNK
ncbi:alpha/beta fold hydrolase [Bacillus horti]|uniref:Pimeloyl-ACP methyl ester carboxylesterase n=1 Tax=Caldalkalibacillus horti TaxID=77523 RepID=A0ABT9VXK5_9BACI|nr:alpha/beta hydrolase [Bacillus horti]MDQ0165730.1 pimeloyl-ACP methyl ester carboxylesterase [Bacillus horti]